MPDIQLAAGNAHPLGGVVARHHLPEAGHPRAHTEAFEELGCLRVEFKTDALNERARAALAAIPSEFEGIHRWHMVVRGGERRDSAWYAVTIETWAETRRALEAKLAG